MANPDDRFYKSETLLKVFGISSVLMMIFTIWMILDDFGRQWKGYQREFDTLKQAKYQQFADDAKSKIDEAKDKELHAQLEVQNKALDGKKAEISKLEKDLDQLKTKEKIATVKYQDAKATWDVEKYQWENVYGHAFAAGQENLGPQAKKAHDKLDTDWDHVLELRNIASGFSQQVDAVHAQLDGLYTDKTKIEKELKIVEADFDRNLTAKKASELTISRLLRSGPIVDMANPFFRLQQIVLPEIRDDIYFAQVRKVDRCTSCHLAIDTPGFENEKNPFKTHPRLDLMLGSRSPHPIDKIGCTVCHEGRGQASEFTRSAHTPQNEAQMHIWEKKYGWEEQHHVIEKMIPLQFVEGKCRVCHKQTEYVPHAEKLNASVQLIRAAGCYGCHRIEGWDHIRKPAPSLKRIKGKVTRDWMVKWVRDPRKFNEYARMPSFFHQSNIRTDEFHQFQEAELFALTDYLMNVSDDYQPNLSLPLGNADKGKELFGSLGCLACHQIDDFPRTRGRFGVAPDLTTVGSKVTKDWLVSWLHNPRHYWAETQMPSLRLSDGEISDLAAYLMSKRNPAFEQASTGKPDLDMQKKVLRQYLLRDPKMAPATSAKVDGYINALSAHDVSMKLGEKTLQRYGCYGCHEVKGYETTPGIGVELTEEGSKPVNKLDFGLIHMEQTNYGWFEKKLEDTRYFDRGVVKEYLDLLRMPRYGFNEEENHSLVMALLGMTSQKIDPPAAKALNSREFLVEQGQRVIHKYNCQGCHIVEGMFASLPDDSPLHDEHEKDKYKLEGRVLAYYADDDSLGPPPLLTEGKRVQTDWVHSFIANPGQVRLRQKLKIRMPSFQMSTEELNKIVTGWAAQGEVEFPYSSPPQVTLSSADEAQTKLLFQKLQCLNCHNLGEKLTPEQLEGTKGLAPNLMLAHERLREAWITALLHDPPKMIPNTRMPGFWPDGQSPAPELLGGNSDVQQKDLAEYVIGLGAHQAPAGKTKKVSQQAKRKAAESR